MRRPLGAVVPIRRFARCVVLALVLLASGTALAQKSGGTLRVTHRDNPPSASIHEEATISTVMPFASVYNNLVQFDLSTDRQNRLETVSPELATAWSWSEDGRRLSMKLRAGVRWHDGMPFTSADVKCTWEQLIGQRDIGLRKNPRRSWYFNLKSVEASGPQDVTFILAEPQPSFLVLLAGGMSPVYPCHVNGAQMRTHPIGTGPFRFGELKQNESMRVVRNPDYWKPGKPFLDAIEFTIIANRSTSVLAFGAGKFDLTLTGDLPPSMVDEVRAQAPSTICEVQTTNTQANLLINRDRPPFDNAEIRRALNLVIDRNAFIEIIGRGQFLIGAAMMPPPSGLWGMPAEDLASVEGYGTDMATRRAQAQGIMRKLGYGPDKPLRLKVSTRNIPAYRDPAVLLIDHIKHAYLEADLEPIDTGAWYVRMLKKDYQVGLNVQGIGIDDPDVVFFENFACGSERNYTAYCNKDMEALFHRQSQMIDFAARRKLVWEIDRKLQEDGARPVISHQRQGTCWWPYVKSIRLSSNSIYNHWRFEDVWLDR
ncbi:MAG: peptide ABC transporter substrate-binding protein [Acetobacteraceae bacterium]|nr:peptide ABC transporter substrate-binding protein [Acetobacteraceae bacterium]